MTSYFPDGDHDVRLPLAFLYAAASAGCPLARRARHWLAVLATVPDP